MTDNRADLFETVRGVLAAVTGTREAIAETTDLIADLAVDSLKVMEIVDALEEVYDISIPLNRLADIRTVRELTACLAELLGD
ncbi:MAG: acyl carrier protein [Deltaproteobacteria bacterium]|nr:acyl carrier protein [Candidatus Anaeroferrophillacea bacterium]